jgi:hypothetical protein
MGEAVVASKDILTRLLSVVLMALGKLLVLRFLGMVSGGSNLLRPLCSSSL